MKTHLSILPTLLFFALLIAPLSATDFDDFTFSDGTNITDTSNSGTNTNQWTSDLGEGTSIAGGILTLGDHNPNTSGNQSFVNLNTGAFNSGTRYLLLEGVTWAFAGGGSGNDRYGIGFTAVGGTAGDREIATIWLDRGGASASSSYLSGYSEGGGTLIGRTELETGISSTGTYDFVLELDLTGDTYEIFFQKDGGGYSSIGSGTANNIGNASGGASSLYFDNDNGGLQSGGETMSISRILHTDVNPIPEPSTFGLLAMALVALGVWRRRMAV